MCLANGLAGGFINIILFNVLFKKSKNARVSIVNSSWPCHAIGPYLLLPQLCPLVFYLGALAKTVVCFKAFWKNCHSLKNQSIVQLNMYILGLFKRVDLAL